MPELSDGPNSFQDPEAALGGADDVDDTRGIPAHGTEPEEKPVGRARALVGAGGGAGVITWIVIAVVILVVLAYGAGFLR